MNNPNETLTVKQLIEKLETLPDDLEVQAFPGDGIMDIVDVRRIACESDDYVGLYLK